jgi:hypothetical protein
MLQLGRSRIVARPRSGLGTDGQTAQTAIWAVTSRQIKPSPSYLTHYTYTGNGQLAVSFDKPRLTCG